MNQEKLDPNWIQPKFKLTIELKLKMNWMHPYFPADSLDALLSRYQHETAGAGSFFIKAGNFFCNWIFMIQFTNILKDCLQSFFFQLLLQFDRFWISIDVKF